MSQGLPVCLFLCGLSLVACSQAPQPVTRKAADQAPATTGTTPAAAPRGSEAERRPGSMPAAAATPATPAAPNAAGTAAASTPATAPAAGSAAAPPALVAGSAAAQVAPANPPASPQSAATPPAHVKETTAEGSLVVVDTNDFDPNSQLSLADAAKAEKERKAEAAPPRIVINNKTIHRYAKGGQLTVAEPKKKAGAAQQPAKSASPNAGPPQDEAYWRGRVHGLRERWRKAADRTRELEQEVSEWRRRFYAQDDPYVRDGQIKPAWDRSLDQLRENRAAAIAAKKELADALEEGRAAGALPGWLRDGIDLEPKEEKPVEPTQPVETPIYAPPRR